MIGELGIHEKLGMLSPLQLLDALKDAAHDIQYGLEYLPQTELALAVGAVFHPTEDPQVFRFDFEVKTDSFAQEFYELGIINTLNAILDSGESDDVPINTGFPFPGTSDYGFTYNIATHDLDLVN
jgi:hypothetical protein